MGFLMITIIGVIVASICTFIYESSQEKRRELGNKHKVEERRLRNIEQRERRREYHFRSLSDSCVDISFGPNPNAKTPELPTEEEQVDALFTEIFETLETGESDLPGLVEVNPDPSPLELELMVGPPAWIVANQSLIGEIQNLWDAKQAAERKAREEKVAQEKADRELAKRLAATGRKKRIEARRLKARLILGERSWKKHQRRVLRGLACSNCYGQHPADICVADTFHAVRWPVSMLSPHSEELGMYGSSEEQDLSSITTSGRRWMDPHTAKEYALRGEKQEIREWSTGGVVRTSKQEPLRVKRPPRLPRGWTW